MRYSATVLIATVSVLALACDGKPLGLTDPSDSPSGARSWAPTVSVSPEDVRVAVGASAKLTVQFSGRGSKNASATLTSKHPEIAAVLADGTVTGVRSGSTFVVASTSTSRDSVAVVVPTDSTAPTPVVPVATVAVTPPTATVQVGSGVQLAVALADSAGRALSGRTVTWSTSQTGVATVSTTGLVTSLAAGTVTITATSEGKTGSATVTVTAPPVAGGACTVVTDTDQKTVPVVPRPGYLQSFIDPVFKTKITRITGDPGTAIPTVGGAWGDVTRHNYSKDAAWNTDQSLIALKQVGGASGILFLDGESYAPLFTRGSTPGETRWHPRQPNAMLYVNGSCEVGAWDVRANTRAPIMRLSGYTGCAFGPYEGNASTDGNMAAALATRSSDGRQVAFALDLTAGTKLPDIDVGAFGVTSVDWVSISPLGRHVVVNGSITGAVTSGGAYDATRVFDLQGKPVGPVWTEYGIPSHYDLSVDVAGNEVAVGVAKTGPYGTQGRVVMRRLTDGVITVLNTGGYAMHTSTRNIRRGGRAYVTHGYNSSWPPFRNEIFTVKLDGSQTVERLAHTHARISDYNAEPHAVPSPDGKRVLFASNWESTSGRPVQAYVVDMRNICP
jgi:hypothetical protein